MTREIRFVADNGRVAVLRLAGLLTADRVIEIPDANFTLGQGGASGGTGSSGLASLSQDPNPTLGGSLAVGNFGITSNQDINLVAAGRIVLDGARWPDAIGTTGQVLTVGTGNNLVWGTPAAGGTSGATAFTGLSDVPASFTGQASRFVAVNASASGLEFVDPPVGTGGSTGATTFTALTDTPSSYATMAGRYVKVNPTNSGLNFVVGPATDFAGTVTVASGGTGATSAAAARTNLGLGSLAEQNANAASLTGGTASGLGITGGSINGTTIGATTASPATFTNLTASGSLIFKGLAWPTTAGTSGQVLTTNGSNTLTWTTPAAGGGTGATGTASITGGSINGATVGATTPASGAFTTLAVNGQVWPAGTGTAGQVLTTNGTTGLSWTTPASGGGGGTGATGTAAITGGSINGASIGATTPSTGKFTTLASDTLSIGGLSFPNTANNLNTAGVLYWDGTTGLDWIEPGGPLISQDTQGVFSLQDPPPTAYSLGAVAIGVGNQATAKYSLARGRNARAVYSGQQVFGGKGQAARQQVSEYVFTGRTTAAGYSTLSQDGQSYDAANAPILPEKSVWFVTAYGVAMSATDQAHYVAVKGEIVYKRSSSTLPIVNTGFSAFTEVVSTMTAGNNSASFSIAGNGRFGILARNGTSGTAFDWTVHVRIVEITIA